MADFSSTVNVVKTFVGDNAPHILTGMAVVGTVSTAVMAAQATTKASGILQDYRDTHELHEIQLHPREQVTLTWKIYIPTALMGAATISCIIAAHTVGTRRQAALASAYSIAEKTLSQYQSKVVEVVGENKERQVREAVAEEQLRETPLSTNQVVFLGDGDSLCFDTLSGRYFKTDLERLKKLENETNKMLIHDTWVSLNDFYDILGLDPIKVGELLGWTTDDLVEFRYESKIADDGTPCLVLDYQVEPKFDPYRRY